MLFRDFTIDRDEAALLRFGEVAGRLAAYLPLLPGHLVGNHEGFSGYLIHTSSLSPANERTVHQDTQAKRADLTEINGPDFPHIQTPPEH